MTIYLPITMSNVSLEIPRPTNNQACAALWVLTNMAGLRRQSAQQAEQWVPSQPARACLGPPGGPHCCTRAAGAARPAAPPPTRRPALRRPAAAPRSRPPAPTPGAARARRPGSPTRSCAARAARVGAGHNKREHGSHRVLKSSRSSAPRHSRTMLRCTQQHAQSRGLLTQEVRTADRPRASAHICRPVPARKVTARPGGPASAPAWCAQVGEGQQSSAQADAGAAARPQPPQPQQPRQAPGARTCARSAASPAARAARPPPAPAGRPC